MYTEWVVRGLLPKQRDQLSRCYVWAVKDNGGLDSGGDTGGREKTTLEGEWTKLWNSK